jgi:hypothetical protein
MKKIFLFVVVSLFFLTIGAYSQNLIAVQNGGNPTFFSNLDSAIVHSQNGDTIYIPGGNFSINVPVEKKVHIVGVGHFPDSTLACGQTRVSGNLMLMNNASDGSLTGVYLLGTINTSGAIAISNYLVQRCRIGGLGLYYTSSNWLFIENVISGFVQNTGYYPVANCFLYNNIIEATTCLSCIGFTNSSFKNNVFLSRLGAWEVYPIKASYSVFENNIFLEDYHPCAAINHSALSNNLFVYFDFFGCSECWFSNNIEVQLFWNIFINQSGNSFSYNHDYHLQPTCPGKNAGKDGTDIGIYGGAFPWKGGSVPINPHVQFQSVSGVDPTGNIHVVVKVAAQDH